MRVEIVLIFLPFCKYNLKWKIPGSTTDGRKHHQHEGGTSSPSPVGSTYTTASESGGPVTIDSEVGNYVSASEDHPVKVPTVATTSTSGEAGYVPQQQQQPQFFNYNQTLNTTSAEVTLVPQHDCGVTRVSIYFISSLHCNSNCRVDLFRCFWMFFKELRKVWSK